MFKIYLSTLMVFVTSICFCGCEKREEKIINLGRTETALEKPEREQEVRVAVGGMITPKEGVVYYRDLLRYIQDKMKKAFLYAHLDPEGREILQKMKIDRFVEIRDEAYDSVREMQDWLKMQNVGK